MKRRALLAHEALEGFTYVICTTRVFTLLLLSREVSVIVSHNIIQTVILCRASGGEKYEKGNVHHGDYVFYKFAQKISINTNQIVRYYVYILAIVVLFYVYVTA